MPASTAITTAYKVVLDKSIDLDRHMKEKKDYSDVSDALAYYLIKMEALNPYEFKFYEQDIKDARLQDLRVTLYLLMEQKIYESKYQKVENQSKYQQQIEQCKKLIEMLERKPDPNSDAPHLQKYVFIKYGQEFGEMVANMPNRQTKTIKEYMGWFNEKRLYWVWGSSLLKSVLSLMPSTFYNTDSAAAVMSMPDNVMGTLSWSLYYFRFFLNLSLVMKHTIAGPWMDAEEAKTAWHQRFLNQLNERKFTLMNDFFWATCNIMCFFWLNAKHGLGPVGDLFTIALLTFDLAVTFWDFYEEEGRYKEDMASYDCEISKLTDKIDNKENKEDKAALRALVQELKTARKQRQAAWSDKEFKLILASFYALGLLCAFVMLALPFIPGGQVPAVIAAVGALLCFGLTLLYSIISKGSDVYATYQSRSELKQALENKREEFKGLTDPDSPKAKLLYLEIKGLELKVQFKKEELTYQLVHFFRSIFFESVTPAFIFLSFVFLPMGVGFGMLAVGLVSAVLSHLLIETTLKPEGMKLPAFNDGEYLAFFRTHDTHEEQQMNNEPSDTKDTSRNSPPKDLDTVL